MHLLLFVQYPTFFSRVIVTGRNSVLPAIESTNCHIRLCENISALNQLDKVFSGETKPLADYLAGNSYYGKVRFKFTKRSKSTVPEKTYPEKTYELCVKVYSALGNTVEEHDERYKRLKELHHKARFAEIA